MKRNYKYWHVVVNGVGFYAKVFNNRVEFPHIYEKWNVPDLVMNNVTRYDVKKHIAKSLGWNY